MQLTNRQLFKMSQHYDEFLDLSFDPSTESQVVHTLAQLDTAINAVQRKLKSMQKKVQEGVKELGEKPDEKKQKAEFQEYQKQVNEVQEKFNDEFEDFLDESVEVEIKPMQTPKGEIKARLLVTFSPIFQHGK